MAGETRHFGGFNNPRENTGLKLSLRFDDATEFLRQKTEKLSELYSGLAMTEDQGLARCLVFQSR
jgi:hypothetical protein